MYNTYIHTYIAPEHVQLHLENIKNQGITGNKLDGRGEGGNKRVKKKSVPRVRGQVPWQRGMALIDSSSKMVDFASP